MRNVLDLFSAAAGGWSLGMHRAGFQTMAACENVAWRRALYQENNPHVRIYDDVRTLTADRIIRDCGYLPDIVVGSPPCQDISSANTKGKGVEGERSGLYFEAIRIIGECRPRWFALENSANLRTRGADAVLAALEALGYTVWSFVVGAGDIGANHERKRSWLIGCDVDQVSHADDKSEFRSSEHAEMGVMRAMAGTSFDSASVGHEGRRTRRHGEDGDGSSPVASGNDGNSNGERCPAWKRTSAYEGQDDEFARRLRQIAKPWRDGAFLQPRNPSNANEAGQEDGLQESSLRPAQISDDGCSDGRGDDGEIIGQMGGSESAGNDLAEPWADWNGGPSKYLWMDARLRSWAFLAILLKEGGFGWAGEKLMTAVKSASSVENPLIESDMANALKTVLAFYSENTVRRLAPIAETLSAACSITLALENLSEPLVKSAMGQKDYLSTTSMKIGPTTRKPTSKRSAPHVTPDIICEQDLKAVHRRAERLLKLFDRRQVEAFGDSVCPQIPEAIGRAIMRVEQALAAVHGRAA